MDVPPKNPGEWVAPQWEPPVAPGGGALRQTLPLAVFASAAWLAVAAFEWFILLLMRRRLTAVRTLVEDGADSLNLSAARLADDQLQRTFAIEWFVFAAIFIIGSAWAYSVAVNGRRLGVPDVEPGKIALQYAIPVLGIGYSIRQLAYILATLGRPSRPLALWLNTMFAYLFVWLGTYLIERISFSGVSPGQENLDALELQLQLAIVRDVMITLIAFLAVRAILHTDRELRSECGTAPGDPEPSLA